MKKLNFREDEGFAQESGQIPGKAKTLTCFSVSKSSALPLNHYILYAIWSLYISPRDSLLSA